jgi:hypothetical protein
MQSDRSSRPGIYKCPATPGYPQAFFAGLTGSSASGANSSLERAYNSRVQGSNHKTEGFMQTDDNASRWTILGMLAVGLVVVFGLVSNDVDRRTAMAPDVPAVLR